MEVVIVIAVVVAFVAVLIIGGMRAAKRRKEMAEWAASKGMKFASEYDRDFQNLFPEFSCLKRGERNRYAYNIVNGSWDDRPIVAFDYHYETTSRDSKGRTTTHPHYFSALIMQVELPLKHLFIRPEGLWDKITEFFGADDIDFESAEFSRKFYVRSVDKKWAYDVLHPRAMEFLLNSPVFSIQFAGRRLIAYRDSTFAVPDFQAAFDVLDGLLDQLPDYIRRELAENKGA